jgi:hypothetical protein
VQETGLLEQTVLLVRPLDPSGRRMLLAETSQPVGFACWSGQRPWWRRWLRPVLAVHEHEEQPLVFTVQRSLTLLPKRDVLDAENERVGVMALPWLLDRWGRPIVEVRQVQRGKCEFLGAERQVLGEWSVVGEALRLEFKPAVQHDPFVKMLLLAAVLDDKVTR